MAKKVKIVMGIVLICIAAVFALGLIAMCMPNSAQRNAAQNRGNTQENVMQNGTQSEEIRQDGAAEFATPTNGLDQLKYCPDVLKEFVAPNGIIYEIRAGSVWDAPKHKSGLGTDDFLTFNRYLTIGIRIKMPANLKISTPAYFILSGRGSNPVSLSIRNEVDGVIQSDYFAHTGDFELFDSEYVMRIIVGGEMQGNYNFTADVGPTVIRDGYENGDILKAHPNHHYEGVAYRVKLTNRTTGDVINKLLSEQPSEEESNKMKKNGAWSLIAYDKNDSESNEVYWILDTIAPSITLMSGSSELDDGNGAPDRVNISSDDLNGISAYELERYDGTAYKPIAWTDEVTQIGQYRVRVTDIAGNASERWFIVDNTRPYLAKAELDMIKALFELSHADLTKFNSGIEGDSGVIELGYTAQSFTISAVHNEIGGLALGKVYISGTLQEYEYTAWGKKTIKSAKLHNMLSFNKLGRYEMTVYNDAGVKLSFAFEIDVEGSMAIEEGDTFHPTSAEEKWLIYKGGEVGAITGTDYERGGRIYINGEEHSKTKITYDVLRAAALANGTHAVITIRARGIDALLCEYSIYIDEQKPDIHNAADLPFDITDVKAFAKTKIKFDIGWSEYEFAESATLEYIGTAYNEYGEIGGSEQRTVDYLSGQTITSDGYYVLTITDRNGNETVVQFTILGELKSRNKWSIEHEYFTAPQDYSVKLPIALGEFTITTGEYAGEYNAVKRYLFATQDNAMTFAYAAEYAACVVEQGSKWLYRPKNQGIQIAYTSEKALSEKIMSTIAAYVTLIDEFKIGGKPYITRGTDIVMDEELKYNGAFRNVDSLIVNGKTYDKVLLIDKNFVLKLNSVTAHAMSIKIRHLESDTAYSWRAETAFGTLTTGRNGLYEITEQLGTHLATYYVYIDNVAPTVSVAHLKAGIEDETVREDIITSQDVVIQVKTFDIESVKDSIDNFSLIYITGRGIDKVYMDGYPTLSHELGYSGEYTVSAYDRSGNAISFTIYIMGEAPTATLSSFGSGADEYAAITLTAPRLCVVMDLSILRNGEEIGQDDEGSAISPNTMQYKFARGGRYTVTVRDNYNRTTQIELKYTKDMPDIRVEGVKAGGVTRTDVKVTLPISAEYSILFDDGSNVTCQNDTSTTARIFTVFARQDNNGRITVRAWYASDPSAYNDVSFTVDTIPPQLRAVDSEGAEVVGMANRAVYLEYNAEEVAAISYRLDGKLKPYIHGQALNLDGVYEAVASDAAGNQIIVQFVLDFKVLYSVDYDNEYFSGIESIDGKQVIVTRSFIILPQESVTIECTLDGYATDVRQGELVNYRGLYVVKITDAIGNIETVAIRVIPQVEGVILLDGDGANLAEGATTNKGIALKWDPQSYIAGVSVRVGVNPTIYDYVQGTVIKLEGSGVATVTDEVGNSVKIQFVIDTSVDAHYEYELETQHADGTLAQSFSVSADEEVDIEVRKDGVKIDYSLEEKVAETGVYEITITDMHGNSMTNTVTVLGAETLNLSVTADSGEVLNNNLFNHAFTLNWDAAQYLASVSVNGGEVGSGARFEQDGKYAIEVRDLLGRVKRTTLTIKTTVDYTLRYDGSYELQEDGQSITLTRGWRAYCGDDSILTVTRNGETYAADWGDFVTQDGDYALVITDSLGNSDTLRIRVLNTAILPLIYAIDGDEIADGAVINRGFTVVLDEYTASVSVNGAAYYGDVITREGRNRITVTDVIGNAATLYITIDTVLDYMLKFDGSYICGSVTLTHGFRLTQSEELSISVTRNGEEYNYTVGESVGEDGDYLLTISDIAGNVAEVRVVIDTRPPGIDVTNTAGELVEGDRANTALSFSWDAARNIDEVRVNDVRVANGYVITLAGEYFIYIRNLLGDETYRTITIRYDVEYEAVFSKEYAFTHSDGEVWTLTTAVRVSGDNVSYSVTRNGSPYTYINGERIATDGEYVFVITDELGNTATLRVIVSTAPIGGEITAENGEVLQGDKVATNENIVVNGNAFVTEILIDGAPYAPGTVIGAEARYTVEFLDVLGRKSSAYVTIDKSVLYEVAHKFITPDGDYVTNKLSVNALEDDVTFKYFLNGAAVTEIDPMLSGTYVIIMTDALGNTVDISVIVDNSPPNVEASAERTNQDVSVSISDTLDVRVEVWKDGKLFSESNEREFLLSAHGKYVITVTDELGNVGEARVEIDKIVDITINLIEGMTVNYSPNVKADEAISYELRLNGELVGDYKLNKLLALEGEYELRICDEIGNERIYKFRYIGERNVYGAMQYRLPVGVEFTVMFDGLPLGLSADSEGCITLDRDGKYVITLTLDGAEYRVSLTIDVTPPELNFKGLGEDNRTSKKVTFTVAAGESYQVYFNGALIDKSGRELSEVGKYRVVITDEAGNVSEIEFVIYYAPNAALIILIIVLVIIAIIAVCIILRRYRVVAKVLNRCKRGAKSKPPRNADKSDHNKVKTMRKAGKVSEPPDIDEGDSERHGNM